MQTLTLDGIEFSTSTTWFNLREGDDWKQMWKSLSQGLRVEVTREEFVYFMDIMPPRYMDRVVTLADGDRKYTNFGIGEGSDPTTAFWGEDGKWWCQRVLTP